MLKLIKMDFYRLITSKALKVGSIAACLMCAVYMLFSLGIIVLAKFALKEDPAMATNLAIFLAQVDWMNGVDFFEVVFSGTAAFTIFVGCMISANFIGEEQSCGYTKNFAGQIADKGYMAISKFVVTSFVQLLILVIYVVVSAILAKLLLGQYINGYDFVNFIKAIGLRLMLHLALNTVIIFICTLTKSHAIAMVIGCVFGIGITRFAYIVLEIILSTLKININVSNYMPDGINYHISLSSVDELWRKALLVSIAFIAVFLAANYIISRKRDVK